MGLRKGRYYGSRELFRVQRQVAKDKARGRVRSHGRDARRRRRHTSVPRVRAWRYQFSLLWIRGFADRTYALRRLIFACGRFFKHAYKAKDVGYCSQEVVGPLVRRGMWVPWDEEDVFYSFYCGPNCVFEDVFFSFR